MKKHHITLTVNGDDYDALVEPQQSLLDVLRDTLMLTGTKEGCGTGDCGACSVTVDGVLQCACLMLGVEANGVHVETIEGMAQGAGLHPLQKAFLVSSAASAPPAFWWPPRPCWSATQTLRKPRCATGSPETCAAAPVTTS